jgi:hypothetical protein
MDVHLRRGSLQSGSDAESDGAACLNQRRQPIHGHVEVVNLLAEGSSGRAKAVLKLRKYRSKNFGYAFQQPAKAPFNPIRGDSEGLQDVPRDYIVGESPPIFVEKFLHYARPENRFATRCYVLAFCFWGYKPSA